MDCISFYSYEGCFNFCKPSEKSMQYIIRYGKFDDKAKELGLKKSFLVDIEYDDEYSFPEYSVLELVKWLKDTYENNYLWHGSIKDVGKVIEFLESVEVENKIQTCKDMIGKIDKEIVEKKKEKAGYEIRLDELLHE